MKNKLLILGLGAGIAGIAAYFARKKINEYLDSDVLVEVADTAPPLAKQLLPSPVYRAPVRTLIARAKAQGAGPSINKYLKISLVKK